MTAPKDGGETLPLSALQDRAEAVASDLINRKLAAPEEIAELKPGGAKNAETGALGWFVCVRQLERMHAVLMNGRPGGPSSAADRAEIEEALAGALAESPETVTLSDGTVRSVYPKSYHALRFLDFLDEDLRVTLAQARLAAAEATTADIRVKAMYPLVESQTVRFWVWILTHEDPGLPFDDTAVGLELPAWTMALSPDDLLVLYQAHHRVNVRRLATIAALFPPEPGDGKSRLSLAAFLGTLTKDRPNQASQLMRRTSLGAAFAAAVTAAAAQRDALRKAKQKSARED